ncbi:hypothetical protein N7450_005014 [Penicillium hetheringtonii]|uniref:DUF952 domain-containing protein n=1 Tax=Penicillium hetheringtonii TaxID=911720 RepID=A0AAD6DSK3_9EURO|nr:hypothetical protein N7450_005014 [Penicillium hetheringtonii]
MAALDTQPRYIYKIVPSSSPIREPLPERLPVSELDQKSGFVHLSMAHQVANTLNTFFKEEPLVYLLRIEYATVISDIRWESPDGKVCGPRPGEGLFPHLYNGLKLGRDEVESIAIWQNEGGWEKALNGAKPWLTNSQVQTCSGIEKRDTEEICSKHVSRIKNVHHALTTLVP